GVALLRPSVPVPANGARGPVPVLHHDRGRRRSRRGDRAHGARTADGAPAAGALPVAGMPAGGGPLAELLAALSPPLEYLAAGDFAGAPRTGLPLDTLAARVMRARAGAPPPLERALADLDEIVGRLRGAPPDARADLLP